MKSDYRTHVSTSVTSKCLGFRMTRTNVSALLIAVVAAPLLLGQTSLGQTTRPPEPKRERFQNAEVLYGWAQDSHGERLRTFITRPINVTGKVPAIFFVGSLSCDSMDY